MTQLRSPGKHASFVGVAAQSHHIRALVARGAVVGVAVGVSRDVMQPQRVSELMQVRALQVADAASCDPSGR